MDRVCAEHGVAAVTGTNPDTGVVGLSTAGGGGYLSRLYGMAVDNFVSAEVVLPSGAIVTASKDNEHKDLFWGIAGAGSNFGVVCKLTMRTYPMSHVFGGLCVNVAPSASRAQRVVSAWRDWIIQAPRSVMSMAVLPCGAPVVPMVAAELDQSIVPPDPKVRVTRNKVPSLKAFGRIAGFGALASIRMFKKMPYHTGLQPLLEKLQASGHYYDASLIVPELSDGVVSTLVEFTRKKHPNSDAGIIIFPLNGAIGDVPTDATAFYGGGRKPNAFWIIIEGKWKPKVNDTRPREKVVTWVKELRAALAAFNVSDTAHTLEGTMESELAGPKAIFADNLERLQSIKAKYDPTNFMKCNRNVPPS